MSTKQEVNSIDLTDTEIGNPNDKLSAVKIKVVEDTKLTFKSCHGKKKANFQL